MAHFWLDAARYADSHGYHIDSERSLWKWREWVIEAFNTNIPFDRFTVEQLAGDLLPEATLPQKIASGYVRCNRSEEHTSELQSPCNLVCRLLLEKKNYGAQDDQLLRLILILSTAHRLFIPI